jgi:hypothetical protein
MSRQLVVGLYLVAMIVVIFGVDAIFLKDRFWPRLIANIGIVLLFSAFYIRFMTRP